MTTRHVIDRVADKCPWPEDIWTMTVEEYCEAIPDKHLRTAISGLLMRQGWQFCILEMRKQLADMEDECDYDDRPLQTGRIHCIAAWGYDDCEHKNCENCLYYI